jgi:hypothetical protein
MSSVGQLAHRQQRVCLGQALDRQARIYRRELGLGRLRRAASKPAPEPEPESDLADYLQRRATNGESSP